MRITRRQLRRIICELSDAEANAQGIGPEAIKAYILDELLPKEKKLSMKDLIQQSEGAGFESEDIQQAIDELVESGEVLDEEGTLELP